MAFTLVTATGTFVPASRDNLVANQALAGFASQDPTSQAALLQSSGLPISYDCRAIANTTAADAASVVLDLSARGLTIPDGGSRMVQVDAYARVATTAQYGCMRIMAQLLRSGAEITTIETTTLFKNYGGGTLDGAAVSVAINTGPAPDTVEVQLLGVAATNINWDVRVFIFPLVTLA